MTKQECLSLLQLLSMIEGWSLAENKPLPQPLLEELVDTVLILRREILE